MFEVKCTRCRRRSAFYMRASSGELLCKQCFVKSIEDKVVKTLRDFEMIEPGDRLGIAVSGGKDSLVLLNIIFKYIKKPPLCNLDKIVVFTVDEEIEYSKYKLTRVKYIEDMCRKHNIEYKVYKISDLIGVSVLEIHEGLNKNGKRVNMCTICGVLRRRAINEIARRENLSKIMTAHNLDDEAQTVLLNVFSNDLKRFKWFGPITGEDVEYFVPRIKPLRYVREEEIAVYAYLHSIPMLERECPYVKYNPRYNLKFILSELEKKNPNIKYMVVSFGDSIAKLLRESKFFERKVKVSNCEICGIPTTGNICRTCELVLNAGLIDKYILKRS